METAPYTADRLTHVHGALVAVGASLGVASAVVIAVAALTTWWVLLALIPLLMMVGCVVMMAAMPWMDAWRSWGCGAETLRDERLARPHYRSRSTADPEVGRERTHR